MKGALKEQGFTSANRLQNEWAAWEEQERGVIEAFDKDSGMLLMKSDGAYYLAAPSDPDTLLNHFELAVQ